MGECLQVVGFITNVNAIVCSGRLFAYLGIGVENKSVVVLY